jgi:hypothetical protein
MTAGRAARGVPASACAALSAPTDAEQHPLTLSGLVGRCTTGWDPGQWPCQQQQEVVVEGMQVERRVGV